MSASSQAPLDGVTVVDCTRLLPGAVLARCLLDLGARLLKVEDPATGDPMRHIPPLVEGTGAAFSAMLAGAESVCLDLRSPEGAAALRSLARHADVVVENFRPGTMERWDLGPERLRALNPALTVCSMSGFGRTGPWAALVAHDLNLTAASGLLSMMPGVEGIPRLQVADVTAAVLASSAILAALLRRSRTGTGAVVDQPLATGVLPALSWAWADAAAGGGGIVETVLAGRAPSYRTYRCGDGTSLAVGALEPKFWIGFVEMLGLPEHAGAGLDLGEAGEAAVRAITGALAAKPAERWAELARDRGIPATPARTLEQALDSGFFEETGLAGEPGPGGGRALPGPFVPSFGRPPGRRAPRLGEHTEAVLAEHGLD